MGCTASNFELEIRSYPNEFIQARVNGTIVRANAVFSGYISDIYQYTEDSTNTAIHDVLSISRQTENQDYQFNISVLNQKLHQQTFPFKVTPLPSRTTAIMTIFQSLSSEDIQAYWGEIEITITGWGSDNIMEGIFNGVLAQNKTNNQLNIEDGSFRLYVVKDID